MFTFSIFDRSLSFATTLTGKNGAIGPCGIVRGADDISKPMDIGSFDGCPHCVCRHHVATRTNQINPVFNWGGPM